MSGYSVLICLFYLWGCVTLSCDLWCYEKYIIVQMFGVWNRVGLIDVAIVHRRWLDGHHDYEQAWWYQWVIILCIICRHRVVDINMQGIEITFECVLAFYFQDFAITRTLCLQSGNTYHTIDKIRYLSVVLIICPYSAYVISDILYTAI